MTGTATIPLLMLLLALSLPWLSVLPATSPRLAPWVRRSLPAAPVVCLLLVFLPPGGQLELPGLRQGLRVLPRGPAMSPAWAFGGERP